MTRGRTRVVRVMVFGLVMAAVTQPAASSAGASPGRADTGVQPAVSELPPTPRQVAAGGFHTCVLLANKDVWCWGYNGYGQLGDGTNNQSLTPVQVEGLPNARKVVVGENHSCALDVQGRVWCWGHNYWGQLGSGDWHSELVPVRVPGLIARDLESGVNHVCALRADDSIVVCWGNNAWGQLGNGQTADAQWQPSVVRENRERRLVPLVADDIVLGAQYSCAHLNHNRDYHVVCWGDGATTATGAVETRPVVVPGVGTNAKGKPTDKLIGRLHGTRYMACADGRDWATKCWGHLEVYGLNSGIVLTPRRVAAFGADHNSLVGGNAHVCVSRRFDGDSRCLGAGSDGQLGNGGWEASGRLVGVRGLGTYPVSISAGGRHSCAVVGSRSDDQPGTVRCWGSNGNGQLGDGSTTNRNKATVVEPVWQMETVRA